MKTLSAFFVLLASSTLLSAGDWTQFGGNPARSGFTPEELPANLSLRWVSHQPAPVPAWPVSNRLGFDKVHHPISVGDRVFFGSTADHQIHALDARTGRELWTFFTGGPVRFAPAAWKDRLFAASDDGWLYCLSQADGQLLWKQRAGSDDRMLLGNDRMISRTPARGGPVVVEDTVYFAAGIWPTEGVSIYALDAQTGKVRWCNDDSGSIFMGQPHGGANAASGVAAQGYLVANEDQLLVPTGRAVPAAFDRATGKFKYFHLQANGQKGGAATLAAGLWFYNAGFTYEAATGKILDPVGAGEVAATPDGLLLSGPTALTGFRWVDKAKGEKGKLELFRYKGLEKIWTLADVPGGASILAAGRQVVAGGAKRVSLVDPPMKKILWSAEVDGLPLGLAVANGRLLVSTDRGTLYCFSAEKTATVHHPLTPKLPAVGKELIQSAEEIVKSSGVGEGFALDLGCGSGDLALEVARRTNLHVIAVDADPTKVAEARRKISAAGLYGTRITVHLGNLDRLPYSKYFADLIFSGRQAGGEAVSLKEAGRLQRPFGGVLLTRSSGALKKSVRGPLEGAGSWTHQYADPGNSCCSTDNLVQGPLGMLWFRDSDLDGPSRHGRGPAPLFLEGRLFVEGLHAIRAVDAYNGRRLWEYPLPNILKAYDGEHLVGTAATQSNYCVSPEGVYIRFENKCLRLDPATGKKLGEFPAPKNAQGKILPWGYLACTDGLLFGSLADPQHVVKYAYGKSNMNALLSESTELFALDAKTGQEKWKFIARHSIRHNALAIGAGKVFLIDRPIAIKDLVSGNKEKEHPDGELIALESTTGKLLWKSPQAAYGTVLSLSGPNDVLLMSYQPTRFKLPSELGGRMAAFQASTGKPLWDREASYTTRPLINGKTVYAQGGSWDLLSGESKSFTLKRSYGCGQLAGSTHLMVFRSATLGYYDLLSPKGVIDYGGLRPGCWINAIPAGGVVMVPDATSGCKCSYLNQAWVVLQPLE